MRMLWGAGERGRDPVRPWGLPGHCPLGLLGEGETRLDHASGLWLVVGRTGQGALILSLPAARTVLSLALCLSQASSLVAQGEGGALKASAVVPQTQSVP